MSLGSKFFFPYKRSSVPQPFVEKTHPFTTELFFFGFVSFCFVCFLGLHPRHMEVPRLGVQSELQLPAYTAATATRDPSHVFNLYLYLLLRAMLDP